MESAIGKSIARVDAFEKVTGRAKYVDDISCPGMLHVKVLRSPLPHARVLSLKTEKASQIPGVRKVIRGLSYQTMEKMSQYFCIGGCIVDQLPMAANKVRYVGEPVAAVVAEDPDTAEEAIKHIEVKYQKLPHVIDPREAIRKGAPLIHPRLGNYKFLPGFYPKPGTNIYHHYKLRKGNISEGFKKSALILERDFTYPHMSHCQIEPHGAVAKWEDPGEVEIYCSAQSPFTVRDFIARAFNLPLTKVRVHMPYIGGGFGGKSDVTIEPLLVHIARHLPGEWIKLVLEREEMFVGSVVGRGMVGKIKMGVKKDGTIQASAIEMLFNAGAYGEYAINVICGGGQNAPGPYRIPHLKVDAYAVYTNLPYVGAFRGYGHPEGHWMTERMMDIVAKELNMDPLQVRLKNAYRPGDINAIGQKLERYNGNLSLCLKKAAKEVGWKVKGKNVTRIKDGFRAKAVCSLMKSPVQATNAHVTAILKFNEDASVNLLISTCEMGQGALTVFSQIASEALQLPLEKIRVTRNPDTELFPYDWQTVASKATFAGGQAIIKAAECALQQVKETACRVFKVPREKVHYRKGTVFVKGTTKKLPLASLVNGYMFEDGRTVGGPVIGYGVYTPRNLQIPGIKKPGLKEGQGNIAASWTMGSQAVEVEVNTKTKEIKVLKLVTAIDAGKIINPLLARGQIVGGMVQALGQALMEKIIYSQDGKNRNPGFTDYKIPTLEDLKDVDIRVLFVETRDKHGPFGARGLGEHAALSIAPAIANAVARATGVEIFDLPIKLNPEL